MRQIMGVEVVDMWENLGEFLDFRSCVSVPEYPVGVIYAVASGIFINRNSLILPHDFISGPQKKLFIPGLIGPFLEVTLVPEEGKHSPILGGYGPICH